MSYDYDPQFPDLPDGHFSDNGLSKNIGAILTKLKHDERFQEGFATFDKSDAVGRSWYTLTCVAMSHRVKGELEAMENAILPIPQDWEGKAFRAMIDPIARLWLLEQQAAGSHKSTLMKKVGKLPYIMKEMIESEFYNFELPNEQEIAQSMQDGTYSQRAIISNFADFAQPSKRDVEWDISIREPFAKKPSEDDKPFSNSMKWVDDETSVIGKRFEFDWEDDFKKENMRLWVNTETAIYREIQAGLDAAMGIINHFLGIRDLLSEKQDLDKPITGSSAIHPN